MNKKECLRVFIQALQHFMFDLLKHTILEALSSIKGESSGFRVSTW